MIKKYNKKQQNNSTTQIQMEKNVRNFIDVLRQQIYLFPRNYPVNGL